MNRTYSEIQLDFTIDHAEQTVVEVPLDALIVLLVVVATVLAFDALVVCFGQDSRSLADDEWGRPWSSSQSAGTEC